MNEKTNVLIRIINAIVDYLFKGGLTKDTKKVVTKVLPNSDYRNLRALKKAAGEIGVKEVVGSGNNMQVVKYHAYARKDNDIKKGLADSVPWCSSFVCYVLESVGMGSTNSMTARSYEKWGRSTRKNPLPGDIAVYWRGSRNGWQGHVGFFLKETDNYIYTLGGNQSNAVNVSKYSKSKLLDIRRSSKHQPITAGQKKELKELAEKLISGKKIDKDGSVV